MAQKGKTVRWKKFHVHLAGKTNNAHRDFVKKLKRIKQKEKPLEKSHYILVFCPIVSRVGTDIAEAMESAPGGKPIILVVMHHTFDPDLVIAESRRLVKNPNVKLTVDCLIYEGKLLKSHHNETAWTEVKKILKQTSLKKSQRSDQAASDMKQEGATGENTNPQSTKTDNTTNANEPMEQSPSESSQQVISGESRVEKTSEKSPRKSSSKGSSSVMCCIPRSRKRTSPSP